MAFCKYCGKQLAEGENCSCEKAQEASRQVTINVSEASEAASKAGLDCLGIIKKPVTNGLAFVNGTNYISAAAMIVIQALFTAIFSIICTGKINAFIDKLGIGMFTSSVKVSGVKMFFVSLLFSALLSVAFAAVFFGINKLFKFETSLFDVIELAGIRAAFSCLATVVSVIVAIFTPYAIGLYYIGGVLALTGVMAVLIKRNPDKEDKAFYCALIGSVVFIAISAFVIIKSVKLFG